MKLVVFDLNGVGAGDAYVEVGTLHGYRETIRLLEAWHGGAGRPRLRLSGHALSRQ